MALFEDKRKPVDMYAKNSVAAAGREKINQAAGSAARAAFINKDRAVAATGPAPKAGGLPTDSNLSRENPVIRWASSTPKSEAAQMIASRKSQNLKSFAGAAPPKPIIGQSMAQTSQRDNDLRSIVLAGNPGGGVAANRAADAMLYGNGEKLVFGVNSATGKTIGNPPPELKSTAADAMAYNSANPEPVAQPTRTVYTNRGNTIVGQQQPMRPTVGGDAVNPSARRMLSTTQRAGNLDIQFDKGTDQSSIQRFMENPVRPTAQIDRFNALRGQDSGQGIRAAANASKILGPSIAKSGPGVELFTKGNSSMGWKTRKELNQQLLANKQSGENARLDADTRLEAARMGEASQAEQNRIAKLRAEGDISVNREQNAINRENVQGQNRVATERVAVDRENVAGHNTERQANAKAKDLENAQVEELRVLQKEYRAEKDPTKKKALENELYALQGKNQQNYQITTREDVGPDGVSVIKKPYIVDREGREREIGAEDPEMVIINSNPKYREAYNSATPERRQAMLEELRKRMNR